MPALRLTVARVIATLLLLSACGGGADRSSTVRTVASFEGHAATFAESAQRALDGTAFEILGPVVIADLVTGLCRGLGLGAIPATIDGLEVGAPVDDREILVEVLTVGMVQVCPDRAPVDLTSFYLDAVRAAVQDGGALSAFDEGDVIRAGPVVCETLRSGAGVEQALLAVVGDLFGVEAETLDGITGVVAADQGLVSGAVLASAAALLCPEYAGDVDAFMRSL
jgi:hypothetical protein